MKEKNIKWKYPEAIVSCEWLKKRLLDHKIRIFDCTTYLHYTDDHPSKPYDVESGYDNYKKRHIPNASFLDIQNKLSDNRSPFKFSIPNYKTLAKDLQELGIGKPFHIVLYSTNGIQWATRVWWLIFILGFKKVSILDGGMKEWKRLGFELVSGETIFKPAKFKSYFKESIFVSKKTTLNSINKKNCVLLNALSSDIHLGKNQRYGRPGRIPGSKNIPFENWIEKSTEKLVSPEKALNNIKKANIHKNDKVINYCGGGIAATLNAFMLRQLGVEKLEIYDNSMSEWAMDTSLPIEVG